jgi:hypothetical protein
VSPTAVRLDGWPRSSRAGQPDYAGRTATLNATAYCASLSNISAGQHGNEQVGCDCRSLRIRCPCWTSAQC